MAKEKGNLILAIAVVVGFTVVIAIGLYLIYDKSLLIKEKDQKQEKPLVCTQEAKVCPDGSSVSRIGLNCEFAECPVVNQCTIDSDCPSLLVECDFNYCPDGRGKCVDGKCTTRAADWKTYMNNEYGFEFQYPGYWNFEESLVFDPKTSKKLFVRYIFKEQIEKQNFPSSIDYCSAYPEDPKCPGVKEIIKVDGDNTANIEYYKSANKNIAHVDILSPDGGMIEFYITDFVATEKVIILQILSTFKFTN